MADPARPRVPDPSQTEAAQLLDVLKALHQVSFNRWEKRRNYEWLLSYAIWGAPAGFIGVVVFGKDSAFHTPASPWKLQICLGLLCGIHAVYLSSSSTPRSAISARSGSSSRQWRAWRTRTGSLTESRSKGNSRVP
jgi:hypothetical protein